MTEDKIKQFCRELLQPVFDQLVDMQYTIISAMNNSLPKDLPDDQKEKLLKTMFKQHQDIMLNSFKAAMPKDLEAKVKEAYDGRK